MNVRSEKHILQTVEGAVAELEWDTSNPLPPATSAVGVEIGFVGGTATKAGGDVLNGATWHGETAAELIQIIRDGRDLDDPAEAPHL